MCYHCATNPSIHHCCCRITAVSSPLSHHGVTFTVMSSQFRRCHCDVTFIITLLRCRCRSRVVAVPSLSHCCGFVVAIMVSPSSSHCRGFVIAVMVSPSHLSQFCRRCCGVAFVLVAVLSSPSWCCLCRRIVMVSSSSRCCLHHCIVAVSSSQFHCRHCGVAFIIALLRYRCHSHIVAVTSLRRRGHGCGHGRIMVVVIMVMVVVALWLLLSLLRHCGRCC